MDPNTLPPVSTKLRAEEFYRLPEDGRLYELIEGEVEVAPSPNEKHQRVTLALAARIYMYLESHAIGRVYTAPFDVELDEENVYQPDVLVVLEAGAGTITARRVLGAPDLAVEVLSKGTALRDRNVKLHRYGAAGVREVWLADVDDERIEIHRLREDGSYALVERVGPDGVLRTPLLPELEIAVAALYR